MKKEYLKPHIKVSTLMYELSLLEGTPARGTGGGPTNTGSGTSGSPDIPTGINETDGETDPYGSHGSSTGGGGNRSKAYNVWEN